MAASNSNFIHKHTTKIALAKKVLQCAKIPLHKIHWAGWFELNTYLFILTTFATITVNFMKKLGFLSFSPSQIHFLYRSILGIRSASYQIKTALLEIEIAKDINQSIVGKSHTV